MLCLGFRIYRFFATSQLALKATKIKVLTYCGPSLQISYPPMNVSMHLELVCCVWHENFLVLFVSCHFKILDEVPVGLHLGQLCQLFTKSVTHNLRGERQNIPDEVVRAWLCWHNAWTSGLCIFYRALPALG